MNMNIWQHVYKILALLLALVVLWRLQIVFLIVMVAFMLTVILLPFVRLLHRYKLPSILAVLIPLLSFAAIVGGVAFYVAPSVAEQLPTFVRDFPGLVLQLPAINELGFTGDDFRRSYS
jgi:predicted PurR-regulated permease PerM